MPTIVYRKSDLTMVGTVCPNMTIDQEIDLNVIPNFSGTFEDYDVIETGKTNFHLENINGVVTVVKNPDPTPVPLPPTNEEVLSQTVANLTLQNADLQNQLQTLSQTIAQMQLG